jgi:AmmeMemoRadiSam system protein B
MKQAKSAKRIREASHAGSWYTDQGEVLSEQLEGWLAAVETSNDPSTPSRALISPHAGYSYSGPTAAWAYRAIDPSAIKRVFVLGPSHHVYLRNCALSTQTHYETPVGDLALDLDVMDELMSTGHFGRMDKDVDEDEHSIEMQLPYLAKIFEGHEMKLVPVLVGSLDKENEELFGKVFARYLNDPENFFVISSDFCHWGKRFSYTFYDASRGAIHESIQWLDHEGMRIIESQNASAFHDYRKKYKNTICGRHPIAVLLEAMARCETRFDLSFVRYAQSSKCKTDKDSSVSYASAVVRHVEAAKDQVRPETKKGARTNVRPSDP